MDVVGHKPNQGYWTYFISQVLKRPPLGTVAKPEEGPGLDGGSGWGGDSGGVLPSTGAATGIGNTCSPSTH